MSIVQTSLEKGGKSVNDRSSGVKRYNLVLPEELYKAVAEAAEERQTTVVELLRKFVKLGLLALQAEAKPDSALLFREGNKETEILML
jgi:hypothetical protein